MVVYTSCKKLLLSITIRMRPSIDSVAVPPKEIHLSYSLEVHAANLPLLLSIALLAPFKTSTYMSFEIAHLIKLQHK